MAAIPNKILHYDVLECLGEGARSVIYRVSDPNTQRVYALKHVVRSIQKDLRFVQQMETEFEISRQFSHVNLRRTYDLKIHKKMLLKVAEAFLLMEYAPGETLDVSPPRSMPDTIDTFIQVAQGIKAMHAMGYVHCDMKPNNVIRNNTGMVKIIDFGQSCPIGTIKERIQGTPDYIAPEQFHRRPVSIQTDVYNLGATLYWCLTAKPIPTLFTVTKKGKNSFLLENRIETPIELNPRIPLPLSNLVMDCISIREQKRPSDMDQVITRLELSLHSLQKPQISPDLAADDTSLPLDDTRFDT
jgi:eukaryotic-like serine/threonine-protein kinase